MTPADYLDAVLALPRLIAPHVSPDGRWVAWTWFGAGPAADVYAAPADGATPPLRLTDTGDDTILVSWSPDSRAVLVAQDRDGNERDRLYLVALDAPLALEPLTEADPHYYIRGGELHPNGRWLVYGANVDLATGTEIEPNWLYRHDLATGERAVIARPEKANWGHPRLSPTGDHILYMRMDRHPAGAQYWLVGSDGAGDREVLNFGDDVKCQASWFPDGQRAVVIAETPTHARLGVWSLADGGIRWLIDDPARNIEHAFVPRNGDQIVVIEVRGARNHPSLLDPATGEEWPFPAVPGNLTPLAPAANGEWVALYASSQQPTDLVRFPLADCRPETFTSLARVWERTPLRRDDFAPAEDFRWQSVDGLVVQGWLYRPQSTALGTIVHVHGGPTGHSRDQINAQIQYFVRQGYVVLDPNYRGSTGFTLAFREAIKEEGWGGREQDDIRTGIEALLRAGITQPGRVGITGTSYGGYSSWCAITRWSPEVLAAAAPICGMTDLVVDYETTRPDLRPYSEEMLGGSPTQVPDRYRERSPIHFVDQIRGKLLIVQGGQDPNVTPENVRAVRAALDTAAIPYDLLVFPDEGHGISRPKNQRVLLERLATFFATSFAE
jgi:dipeptidyl aminopeptidase/acylaminoacyl peptidase